MKKVNSLFYYVLIITIVVAVVSCSKTGPTGPAGAVGPAGNTGPAGPKGDTGIANVIYSDWLDLTMLPETTHTGVVIDTVGWYQDINAPKLSNNILTTGEIKVYINLNNSSQPDIVPLPYYSVFNGVNINPEFFLQTIEITSNLDVSTYTDTGIKYQQIRYILIPGAVHGRSAIDWNNYDAVKKYLGIKD